MHPAHPRVDSKSLMGHRITIDKRLPFKLCTCHKLESLLIMQSTSCDLSFKAVIVSIINIMLSNWILFFFSLKGARRQRLSCSRWQITVHVTCCTFSFYCRDTSWVGDRLWFIQHDWVTYIRIESSTIKYCQVRVHTSEFVPSYSHFWLCGWDLYRNLSRSNSTAGVAQVEANLPEQLSDHLDFRS